MREQQEPRRFSRALVLLACGMMLFAPACKRRTVQAAPPVVVSQPAPAPAEPVKAETRPEPAPAKPEPTAAVPATKPSSPRARPAAQPPATQPPAPAPAPAETAPKPAAPQMSPRMSPQQQAEHEQKTREAVGTAERNLQKAYGPKLNAAQLDMVEKIRGFLGQAREASRAADWVRALNLAQKALVLSNELVGSL